MKKRVWTRTSDWQGDLWSIHSHWQPQTGGLCCDCEGQYGSEPHTQTHTAFIKLINQDDDRRRLWEAPAWARRVGEMKTLGRRAHVHHQTCGTVLVARFSSFKKAKLVNIPFSTAFTATNTTALVSDLSRYDWSWSQLVSEMCVSTGKTCSASNPRTEAKLTCENHPFWGQRPKWQKHTAQVYHQYYIWSWVSTGGKEHHNMMQHLKHTQSKPLLLRAA